MFDFWTSIGTGLGFICLVVGLRILDGDSIKEIFKGTTNSDVSHEKEDLKDWNEMNDH